MEASLPKFSRENPWKTLTCIPISYTWLRRPVSHRTTEPQIRYTLEYPRHPRAKNDAMSDPSNTGTEQQVLPQALLLEIQMQLQDLQAAAFRHAAPSTCNPSGAPICTLEPCQSLDAPQTCPSHSLLRCQGLHQAIENWIA